MNRDAFWRLLAELTLGTCDQHGYVWSMLWSRLPNKAQYHMARGDRILMDLRSSLESEMFATGGPQDINLFYPGSKREPRQTYSHKSYFGRRPPAMTREEWCEIADELDWCYARAAALRKFMRGRIRAENIDRVIKYQDVILREKMALEPYALKQIGDWSVLYPDTEGGVVS